MPTRAPIIITVELRDGLTKQEYFDKYKNQEGVINYGKIYCSNCGAESDNITISSIYNIPHTGCGGFFIKWGD